MKRVLLIQGTIPHYRVPVFNELARRVDLTVLYSYGELPKDIKFKVIKVPTFKLHYKIHKSNLYFLAQKFDALIVMFDLSYLYFRLLPLLPRKFKVIYWGIGVSASYNNRYDEDKSMDNALLRYIKYSDACVFYSSYPVKKYTELGVSNGKLFVANNTVQVLTDIESNDKTNIIFVGSLYKQKKIHELLVNYLAAYNERHDIPNLIIIGEGDEYETIKKWILDKELDEKIELKSAVYNEKELSSYFASAIVCISPDQAGLTVLKSMGYGVPFVTMHNSITGGEIFNIEDGVNGLLIKSFSEIKSVILDTCTDKEKFIRLGLNAKDFYNSDRTVEKMVDGFEQSINYVLKEGG